LGEASIAPNGEETITVRIDRESINEGINHLELTFSQIATLSFTYPMTRWGTRLKVDTARQILVSGYLRGIKLRPLD
jgi:hypothetical protein